MNSQSRTLLEYGTSLTPAQVLARAQTFFARRGSIYAAFVEQESPVHVSLRGQGGEEIVIGAVAGPGGTRVTGSSYEFDFQIQRFFTTLPPVAEAAS